jgi:SAM-dependent methyltransferase/GT2 family glycosyltransferase
MIKVSVVSATFNRGELLDKALSTYARQTLPADEWEYILVDDGSQDDTEDIVQKYIDKGLPIRLLNADKDCGLPKEEGQWRDGCTVRNVGSTFAHGKVIVATHPEIMIPPDALEKMYEAVIANPKAWITAIPYWIPKGNKLPRGWHYDLNKLREMEGFYDENWPDEITAPGAIDYTNNNQEVRPTWESEVFWAMDMGLWREIGGFRQFNVWGSVDMDFVGRRKAIGIPTKFVYSDDSPHKDKVLMVYHLWHESKRDMEEAIAALKGASYATREQAIRAGGLHGLYNHGHRERATDGKLGGILGDHIARYRFGQFFATGKDVLDIPCGTGYGAQVLGDAPNSYVGVDIDEESIRYADENYGSLVASFHQGSMLNIPAPDETFDRVYSFEGMEHLHTREDQVKFVQEIRRVLRPNGTFIISTPQRGATGGTMWDVSMLTPDEFMDLFHPDDWKGLDWFFQASYGMNEVPVQEGKPPATAEIMILGGSKHG